MEHVFASKCTHIRRGGGGQLSPCPHQSSAGHGCWLPSTPTSTWWRCLLMTSNCAFAGAAKSSQKLADLLIIFLLSFKTQRFQDLEKLLFARPFGWPIFWLLPRPSIILSKNSCTIVRRLDLLQIFQPKTAILTLLCSDYWDWFNVYISTYRCTMIRR